MKAAERAALIQAIEHAQILLDDVITRLEITPKKKSKGKKA